MNRKCLALSDEHIRIPVIKMSHNRRNELHIDMMRKCTCDVLQIQRLHRLTATRHHRDSIDGKFIKNTHQINKDACCSMYLQPRGLCSIFHSLRSLPRCA